MSFYTSLYYYRAERIDQVDARCFAPVIRSIIESGIVSDPRLRMSLRYIDGSIPPDLNRRVIDATEYVGLIVFDGPEFDTEEQFDTLDGLIGTIRRIDRSIGGALFDFGLLDRAVGDAICGIDPSDNPDGFAPDSVSISLDTISLGTLEEGVTESLHTVALSIHGNGYLYPVTPASVIERAASIPQIAAIAAACRAAWHCDSGWAWGIAEG